MHSTIETKVGACAP